MTFMVISLKFKHPDILVDYRNHKIFSICISHIEHIPKFHN